MTYTFLFGFTKCSLYSYNNLLFWLGIKIDTYNYRFHCKVIRFTYFFIGVYSYRLLLKLYNKTIQMYTLVIGNYSDVHTCYW